MFLNTLKREQKNWFMDLAYLVAISDGEYSNQEKSLMDSYVSEMGIVWDRNEVTGTVETIIEKFRKNCNEKEKKIIVFEIIGLTMSDGHYDDDERKIVSEICKSFCLHELFADECEKCIKEYLHLQIRMNRLIEE